MSSCVYAMGKSTPGDQNPVARSSHPLLRSNLSHIFFTRELISVTIFLPFSVARDWRLNYCLIAGGGWLLFASVCISLHHLSYGTAFSLYSGVVAGKNIFTTTWLRPLPLVWRHLIRLRWPLTRNYVSPSRRRYGTSRFRRRRAFCRAMRRASFARCCQPPTGGCIFSS